jgi:hypothetical protein
MNLNLIKNLMALSCVLLGTQSEAALLTRSLRNAPSLMNRVARTLPAGMNLRNRFPVHKNLATSAKPISANQNLNQKIKPAHPTSRFSYAELYKKYAQKFKPQPSQQQFIQNDAGLAALIVAGALAVGGGIYGMYKWLTTPKSYAKTIADARWVITESSRIISHLPDPDKTHLEIAYMTLSETELNEIQKKLGEYTAHQWISQDFDPHLNYLATHQERLRKNINELEQNTSRTQEQKEELQTMKDLLNQVMQIIPLMQNRRNLLNYHEAYFNLGQITVNLSHHYEELSHYFTSDKINENRVRACILDEAYGGRSQFPLLAVMDKLNRDITKLRSSIFDCKNQTAQKEIAKNLKAKLDDMRTKILSSNMYVQELEVKRTWDIEQEKLRIEREKNAIEQQKADAARREAQAKEYEAQAKEREARAKEHEAQAKMREARAKEERNRIERERNQIEIQKLSDQRAKEEKERREREAAAQKAMIDQMAASMPQPSAPPSYYDNVQASDAPPAYDQAAPQTPSAPPAYPSFDDARKN